MMKIYAVMGLLEPDWSSWSLIDWASKHTNVKKYKSEKKMSLTRLDIRMSKQLQTARGTGDLVYPGFERVFTGHKNTHHRDTMS